MPENPPTKLTKCKCLMKSIVSWTVTFLKRRLPAPSKKQKHKKQNKKNRQTKEKINCLRQACASFFSFPPTALTDPLFFRHNSLPFVFFPCLFLRHRAIFSLIDKDLSHKIKNLLFFFSYHFLAVKPWHIFQKSLWKHRIFCSDIMSFLGDNK